KTGRRIVGPPAVVIRGLAAAALLLVEHVEAALVVEQSVQAEVAEERKGVREPDFAGGRGRPDVLPRCVAGGEDRCSCGGQLRLTLVERAGLGVRREIIHAAAQRWRYPES